VCCVRLHLMLSAKALGMLVKSAHKNWKKAKEDKFCADKFCGRKCSANSKS